MQSSKGLPDTSTSEMGDPEKPGDKKKDEKEDKKVDEETIDKLVDKIKNL